IWEALGGGQSIWHSAAPYLVLEAQASGNRPRRLHLIRDLSAWAPLRGSAWEPTKASLLDRFSALAAAQETRASDEADACEEIYVIAANDGQLVESWQRLPRTPAV